MLENGISLRIDEFTEVAMVTPSRVRLTRGRVYVDTIHRTADERLEIETPAGVASDVGTQFEVRYLADDLRIRVREGQVVLQTSQARIDSSAGEEMVLDGDHNLIRTRIAGDDPEWQWVGTVAPTPSGDHPRVSTVLRWVARETGQELRFASPEAESRAEKETLNRSVENMTPLQALEVVQQITDFDYAIEDGDIVIIARGSAPQLQ